MPIPFLVSNFLPSAQLNYTMKYYAVYAEKLERLYGNILKIPKPVDTKKLGCAKDSCYPIAIHCLIIPAWFFSSYAT
jgi:hypothetical protein